MNIVEKFSYPVLERVTNDDGTRFYTCPETGTQMASVTTILSHGADKKHLLEWRKRVGEAEAERQSSYGKNLGSLVHKNVEDYIEGLDRPTGNAPLRILARKMSQRIIDECLPFVDEVWGIEKALYYPGIAAGTSDLIGTYMGKPAIIDHKNAKKMRKRDDIEDYFLQLAAYAEMHNNKYGTNIDQGVIFMVARDLEVKRFVVEGAEFQAFKNRWWQRVENYYEHIANGGS